MNLNITNENRNSGRIVRDYINDIDQYEKIIIFGALNQAEKFLGLLKRYGLSDKVQFIIDNNKQLWNEIKYGYQIKSPKELKNIVKKDSNILVVIAANSIKEIKKQLEEMNLIGVSIDIRGALLAVDYFKYSGEEVSQIISQNESKYQEVYNVLEDKTSRKIYSLILKMKLNYDNKYISNLASEPNDQYFEPEIVKLTEDEIFVDCGSYNGDTLNEFFVRTGGKHEKYIAFEADPNNFKELTENVKKNELENIECHQLACWDQEEELFFTSNLTASQIQDQGDLQVLANSLDNVLKDEKVTFIKMDIEGAEERALLGARKLIEKNSPILAICLYHSLEDYYKLPLLIKEINPDYKLFVRHYKELADVETVCYAIPPHRL